MNKKILILTFYYEPDLCAGSFRSSSIVNKLRESDPNAEIFVFASQPNRYTSFKPKMPYYELVQDKIHIYRSPTVKLAVVKSPINFLIYSIYTAYQAIKIKRPEVTFATSSRMFTALLGLIISKLTKSKRFIVDIRDIFSDTLSSVKKNLLIKIVSNIIYKIEKIILQKADTVVFVSEAFLKYFKDVSFKEYYVFTNGIDEKFLNISYQNKIANRIKKIVYLGNIGDGQGLQKILPDIACRISDDYIIEVYGGGKCYSSLVEVCRNINLKNKIKIYGPVERGDVANIYKQADYLFLHLNDCKAFEKVLPSKLFEYASTKKPIIAGVKGYPKEFINENISGCLIFEPCNSEDFFSKFKKNNLMPYYERTEFINKYSRKNISKKMAQLILSKD